MSQVSVPCVLWRASETDLEFVHATERLPGYENLIAQWSIEQHRAACNAADTCYLIGGRSVQMPEGFVILQPMGNKHEGTKIKRIGVTSPGAGFGRALLAATFHWIFEQTTAPRIWLDVFVHNPRAIASYRASGMTVDGVLRAAYQMPDGRYVDRLILSILRDEWAIRKPS